MGAPVSSTTRPRIVAPAFSSTFTWRSPPASTMGKPAASPLAITERTLASSGTASRRKAPLASVLVSGTLSLLTSRSHRTTAEATGLPSGPTTVPETVRRFVALAAAFATGPFVGRAGA